jgi:hypothetical protein
MMVVMERAVEMVFLLHHYPDLDHPLSPEPKQAPCLIASGPLKQQQDLPTASAAYRCVIFHQYCQLIQGSP